MRIKKVRLKNGYKRFRDTTIDLGESPARIIALVGPNGCGKSSVLDGLLFHGRAYEMIGEHSSKDYRYHSLDGTPGFSYQNVDIEFTTGTYAEVRQAREALGKQNTMLSFRSPYRYNSALDVTEVSAVEPIYKNNYGAGDSSSLDAKMEANYRRLLAKYNRYRDDNDVKPSEAREKIVGDLNKSIEKCLSLRICDIGNVEASEGSLFFEKTDHPNKFAFNVLSSGEKEVVDILLDLYLRQDDYNETIFLLDEPELHVNTSIQRNLLVEIDRLVGDDCQIWLTTHSIGFLRTLQKEMKDSCQIIYFKPEYELAKKPYVLEPSRSTVVGWREIFSVALDDLAELVSPKTIIYCEGRDQPRQLGTERGLDAKVYNTIFAQARPETLFISSGGNTELDQRSAVAIAILSKVLPTVEILVFKDRDQGSGKAISEADRQIYLSGNPPNHRIMKRWEMENYLFDKEVLKAYCSGKSLPFDEVAFDTLVNDIANEHVKECIGKIKNFCGINTSINPDVFKLELSKVITEDMDVYKELFACIFERA